MKSELAEPGLCPMPVAAAESPAAASAAPRSRSWRERFVSWGPWAVPVLYLALVFLIQPWDRLGPPDGAEWTHLSLYDDHDEAALALRGLNDRLGRRAGRVDPPDLVSDADYSRALHEEVPLAPRYYLEYPHAALALFRLGWLVQGPPPAAPAALLDGDYINIVYHKPQGPFEQDLWRRFRWATRFYLGTMVLCLLGLVAVLRAGYEPGGGLASAGALLLLPAMLYFSVHRFDIVPALLTALSLACLGRRRCVASAAFLAAGAMVKVYPVLLAPLVLRYLGPRRRDALTWAAAFAVTAGLIALPALLQGWDTFVGPYKFQLNREPEPGQGHFYGVIFPWFLSANDLVGKSFRLGSVLLTVALLLWRPIPDLGSLLHRGALVVLVFVTVPVFCSQQWIVWLAPLLLPLVRPGRRRALFWLIVALDAVTFLSFPLGFLREPPLIVCRFITLAALAVVLVRAEWFEKTPTAGDERRALNLEL